MMDVPEIPKPLQDLPKPMIAAIFIAGFILLILILKPRHTICDSQMESLQSSQAGLLFPVKSGKRTQPGKIQQALEICRFGNSSGSCYEYFELLRRAAVAVKTGATQCTSDMLSIPIEKYSKYEEYGQVRDGGKMRDELSQVSYRQVSLEQVFSDGLEIMTQKAWGEGPPEPGQQRFGWFRETEMNAFCHVRDVLLRSKGKAGFQKLAHSIYEKLPGEAPSRQVAGAGLAVSVPRRATLMMPDAQIYERTILSAPCDVYR